MPHCTTRDGNSIHVKDNGEGRTVVFIHGWPLTGDMFEYQSLALLEAGYRVITYDRRGFGQSSHPAHGYDYDTFADDLADVMAALGVTDATMVGHSMGNGEIARYVTRHGASRVARIVMAAPSLPFMLNRADNPDGPSTAARTKEWQALWATNWVDWLGQAVPAAYGPDASLARVDQTLRVMLQTPPHVAIQVNNAVVETDFRAELRQIATPTLVLHGDVDQSCPQDATGGKLPDLMPNCRLKVYPGADHTFIGGHARQIADDTLAFIAETARAAAA